jgi:hypothetical protein
VLRCPAQHVESLAGGDAVAFHQGHVSPSAHGEAVAVLLAPEPEDDPCRPAFRPGSDPTDRCRKNDNLW